MLAFLWADGLAVNTVDCSSAALTRFSTTQCQQQSQLLAPLQYQVTLAFPHS